ncbi:hypothetical protein LTR62_002244 [Meristemomyces frigidus]|uniref:SET domain-containing protein n=1 Tax=Meristemomyces frigidus TaxID=1508187 RepID=A0AAN7TKY2_9PEZI|nr:hypothetical protein LTR62_002244 [Meristemomyces frigidus]
MSSRATKRKKLASAAATLAGDDYHAAFAIWSRERGVEIGNVTAATLPGRGLGLITTATIAKGNRMLFVPARAMFMPDMPLLKKHKLAQASPQAQLAFSAMAASKTPGMQIWQATWPTDEDFERSLPMRWPVQVRDLLPPSIDQPLRRQEEDYRKDWLSLRDSASSGFPFDEQLFRYYWSIVNSRSFHWKPPKGRPGSMVMCPFIDYMNHGPTGTSCDILQRPNGYEVLAERDYESGEEVLATYGAHPNDKLLVHYGFVLSGTIVRNIDDDVRLDQTLLPAFSTEVRKQLRDVGFLGGYALLPASNELCFKTQVAVRAMLLTCNEWEYFMGCGEDLTEDQGKAVASFVRPLLRQFRAQAIEKLDVLQTVKFETGLEYAVSTLRTRWEQIVSAIDAFTGA